MTPAAAPSEIRASVAAERLGLTKQAIGLWCAKPGAPVRKSGTTVMVRWPEFARWREQEMVATAKKAPTGSFVERRQEAEARSAEIRAEMDALGLAEKRGEVVAIDDYEAALGTILDRLTARLRAMPVRLSDLGAAAEAAVEREVERIVTELNAWDEDVVDEDDDEAIAAEAPA